ncbi:MAG: peptidoglycan-binding protein [Coprobacillaceae bacterium]
MNNQTGSLSIQVFMDSIVHPINNVTIEVRLKDEILYTLSTDVSGKADTITLEAPPIEDSLSESSTSQPYTEYQLVASKDNYNTVVINNVQIYPMSHAIQNIYLKHTPKESVQVVTIKEPTLYGNYPSKIPEASVKPLPPGWGYIVLEEVVIPEYIIVHDGKPNDKAINYQVNFKDYIKNVACCEVYSTWPVETIKANVYAIISFTLNRVYTEWYHTKGYDFTITSATSHDQAYSHDRTFYEEISTIVDEIFTSYITKPDIRQPLFTQYCDGKKVSCPGWMQQWKSKDLGMQGKSAIEILKSFYGPEIYLEEANKVEGIPISFNNVHLELGSTGNDVAIIQEQLNVISNDFPLIPKVKVDSIYDEQTKNSIEVFQEVFNIPVTGIVDKRTWYKLSELYVAVSKMIR